MRQSCALGGCQSILACRLVAGPWPSGQLAKLLETVYRVKHRGAEHRPVLQKQYPKLSRRGCSNDDICSEKVVQAY